MPELPARLSLSLLIAFLAICSSAVASQWEDAADGRKQFKAAGESFVQDVESGRVAVDGLPAEYVILRTKRLMALADGRIDEAIRLQEQVVEFADRNLPPRIQVHCHVELVRLLFAYDKVPQGRVVAKRAVSLLDAFTREARVELVPVLMAVAEERFRAGDLATGESLRDALLAHLQSGMTGREKATVDPQQVDMVVRAYVAQPYVSRQRLDVVESWLAYRTADPAARRTGFMAEVALFLARQYSYRGDLPLAESHLDLAYEIWTAVFDGESQELLKVYGLMGSLYEQIGDDAGAMKSYEQGITLGLKFYDPGVGKVAALRNDLSQLLMRRGEWQRAEKLVRQTIRDVTNRHGQFRFQVGRSFYLLAMAASAKGDAARRAKYLKRAYDIMAFTVPKNHPDLLEVQASMAEGLLADGEFEQAATVAEQCLSGSRELYGDLTPLAARALAVIGQVQYRSGDAATAFSTMLQAESVGIEQARLMNDFPSEQARRSFFEASRRNVRCMFDVFEKQSATDEMVGELYDIWLNRKGVFFDSQMRFQQLLMVDRGSEEDALFARLLATRSELASLAFSSAMPDQEKAAAIRQLQTRRNELVEQLNILNMGNVDQAAIMGWKDITLPSGSALVDFVYTRGDGESGARYRAFVLRAGGAPQMIDLGDGDALDATLLALREEIGKGRACDAGKLQQESRSLYARLFAPLRAAIGDASRLVVVPDGLLNLLPMGVLSPGPDRYLVEQYRFSYLATARELLNAPVDGAQTDKVVVFANPDFASTLPGTLLAITDDPAQTGETRGGKRISLALPPLPETEIEGQAIVQMAGDTGVLFTGGSASKLALFTQKRPRILHLASHGFFFSPDTGAGAAGRRSFVVEDAMPPVTDAWLEEDTSPLLRSGIVLAGANSVQRGEGLSGDGLLTAEEVLSLDLYGTELVTLSACDTGLGVIADAEGVYGLRRSFRLAGAANLIVSMWSVPDRETREMMVGMYDLILNEKMSPGNALHQTVLTRLERARRSDDASNPMFWAGFIQYGVQ